MAELSVTLKGGKGYEAPWIVVRGESAEEVAGIIAAAVGQSADGLTLVEVTHNAALSFQQVTTAGTVLGGTVIPQSAPAPQAPAPAPAPQAQPEQNTSIVPSAELLTKIEAAKSQEELGDLFFQNKGLFESDPSLMAALEAKAASLS